MTAVDLIVEAVQELSLARTVPEIHRVVTRTGRKLTGADGCGLVMVEDRFAFHVDEDGRGPGWRGRRIPLDSAVAGWCISEGHPVVIEDVRDDIRIPVAAYWSTPITAVAMVPVRSRDPIGAVAAYWSARHVPTGTELRQLQALADSASLALDNATVRATLEDRVRRRTSELEAVNRRLQTEIAERKKAEEEIRRLSLVDELTGLYNRRGFSLLAGRELKAIQRSGRRALVIYIDLDGLKQANDQKGHDAGDRLLQRAASVLRSVTRDTDVAARMGGDEFAVFMTLGFDHPPLHLIVERYLEVARTHDVRWSVGATATPPGRVVMLDDLLVAADEAMYRGRRARRDPQGAALAGR